MIDKKRLFKIILAAALLTGLFWALAQGGWHVRRNRHNQLPAGQLTHRNGVIYTDEAGRAWELQAAHKNLFHQPGQPVTAPERPYPNLPDAPPFDPDNPNLKFLCPLPGGGSWEAILQPDGHYLTSGIKQGTYNYVHPGGIAGSIGHAFADVLPHFFNADYSD